MTKKKWALLVIAILIIFGWFKLFYATYSEQSVPASADCIVALDIKRIIRTELWNIVTTPSRWSFGSSAGEEDPPAIEDMIKVPDYAFIFHVHSHPDAAWYTLLEINNERDFAKGLKHYGFTQQGNFYQSAKHGVAFIRNKNHLLTGNAGITEKKYLEAVANDLFVQNKFISKSALKAHAAAGSHLSAQLLSNSWLKNEQLITANYSKQEILVSTKFDALDVKPLNNTNFNYCDTSLLALRFIQPGAQPQQWIPKAWMEKLSTACNINMDSLLLPRHQQYQLDFAGIYNRIDSAISYSYDDNFNQVATVVANTIQEPSFQFKVLADNAQPLFNYFERNGKLEQTEQGAWFTPVPFAKAYCRITNPQELSIATQQLPELKPTATIEAILYCRVLLSKIPAALWKYLPDQLVQLLSNIETVELLVKEKEKRMEANLRLIKKKNDQPVIPL